MLPLRILVVTVPAMIRFRARKKWEAFRGWLALLLFPLLLRIVVRVFGGRWSRWLARRWAS